METSHTSIIAIFDKIVFKRFEVQYIAATNITSFKTMLEHNGEEKSSTYAVTNEFLEFHYKPTNGTFEMINKIAIAIVFNYKNLFTKAENGQYLETFYWTLAQQMCELYFPNTDAILDMKDKYVPALHNPAFSAFRKWYITKFGSSSMSLVQGTYSAHFDASTPDLPEYQDYNDNFSELSKKLPGINELVDHPIPPSERMLEVCVSYSHTSLKQMIAHLNDEHRWSREEIADWLDELHDRGIIDIEFKIEIGD